MGKAYSQGLGIEISDDPEDFSKKAYYWYNQAANQGHIKSQTELYQCYYFGIGVEEDKELADTWLVNATILDDPLALMITASNFQEEGSYDLAIEFYQRVTQDYYDKALYSIGNIYENHLDKPYYKEAHFWYQKSAQEGSKTAMKRLGHLYENGLGVTQDYQKAADNISQLEQKERKMMKFIGQRSLAGNGKAEVDANKGNYGAQLYLGCLYEHGFEIEKNINQANFWYRKAAENDLSEAHKKLTKLLTN